MKHFQTLILLFALVAASDVAHAQGVLIPDPVDRVVPRITLRAHRVDVRIREQVATTRVEQVFENSGSRPLEATYLFPIPETASLGELTMWVDGRKMSGELVDAERARRIYQDIVRRMRDPALLEYAGQNLFRARVFPVPPKGEVRIEIAYDQVVEMDAGLAEYRYPLGVRPAVNPASGEFVFKADIEAGNNIKSLYCPNHDVERRVDGRHGSVSYEGEGNDVGADMTVFYSVSAHDVSVNLVCHRRGGGDGHFMLLVSPGRLEQPRQVVGKDIVFVIDRSGSMSGPKIDQARDALRFCLNNLNQNDRFSVVTFASEVDVFDNDLVPADRRWVEKALDFVDGVEARGGTDIDHALRAAAKMFHGDRPHYIVFLTDGLPTVGTTDINRILNDMQDLDDGLLRLFAFGVGFNVNTHLLDRLASDNHGTVSYVLPNEDIEVEVSSFYAKVSQPVLADLELDFGAADVEDIYPRDLPDLFNGGQLIILGRYRRGVSTEVSLSGSVNGERRTFVEKVRFASTEDDFAFVPRLWASRKIAHLVEAIREHGRDRELVDEIIELSQRYGIVTPYTSYLIVEEGGPDLLGRDTHMRIRESEPSSVRSMPAMGLSQVEGEAAVRMSKMVADKKSETTLGTGDAQNFRVIGAKTFYREGGEWVDASYQRDMKPIELEFLGEDYFALVEKNPAVGEYLALGEHVLFVVDGQAYRVVVR